jgi:hypothetical protein
MAVYTCYEMVADCRANKREGWSFFAQQYWPVIRVLKARYFPQGELNVRAICAGDALLFDKPVPEREFVAKLRQHVMAICAPLAPDEPTIDLETLTAALGDFSPLERQAVWMSTMRYQVAEAAPILRMDSKTLESARERALEALRQRVDHWSRDVLERDGRALGVAAEAASGEQCIEARAFLDLLDGKMTWQRRADIEFHVNQCWHCVDHLCRLREVDELLRDSKPDSEDAAASLLTALGFTAAPAKKGFWRRMGR